MKTLYVADLDGTVLTTDGKLTEKTRSTLNSLISHGLNFTVNTSRTPKSAAEILEKLNLKLPAIMMNGSAFFDRNNGHICDFSPIPTHSARKAAALCTSGGCEPFWFGFKNGEIEVKYTRAQSEDAMKFMSSRKSYYKSFTREQYLNPDADTLYIICIGKREALKKLKPKIDALSGVSSCIFVSNGEGCYLEIYSSEAGKWNATKKLKEQLNFERVVCFGDNLNDIEMLKNADLGVATANGYDETKAAADLVIESCDCDAVAEYLMIEWSRQIYD